MEKWDGSVVAIGFSDASTDFVVVVVSATGIFCSRVRDEFTGKNDGSGIPGGFAGGSSCFGRPNGVLGGSPFFRSFVRVAYDCCCSVGYFCCCSWVFS